jgi:hypothetical protein
MVRRRSSSFLLTIQRGDDKISPARCGRLPAAAHHIADMSQRYPTPPSSSGPGRGPLKAQTAIRIRLGAHIYRQTFTHPIIQHPRLIDGDVAFHFSFTVCVRIAPFGRGTGWRVDPDRCRELNWGGRSFHKSLEVLLVSNLQYLLPPIQHRLSSSEMNICGCQKTKGTVVMFVVVPLKES